MRRALLLGYPYHTRTLARFVNEYSTRWRIIAGGNSRIERNRGVLMLPFVDAALTYGGPAPDALIAACARRLHVPMAVIWGGTDVVRVRNLPELSERTRAHRYEHVACSSATSDELSALGIHSTVLRLAIATPPRTFRPFTRFAVLAYLPGFNERIYGAETIVKTAKALPEIPFDVIGDKRITRPTSDGNITYRGWEENIEPYIDSAVVLLRPTERDGGGPPLMVLEAMARGRYVIWSRSYDGAIYGKTVEEAVPEIARLHELHRANKLDLNMEGVEAIRRTFAPEVVTRDIELFLDELVAESAQAPRRRAVVSGTPGLVARFVESEAENKSEWQIHPLIGESRAERLDDLLSVVESERWFSVGADHVDPLVNVLARILRKGPVPKSAR
jgi:hypothetical protein